MGRNHGDPFKEHGAGHAIGLKLLFQCLGQCLNDGLLVLWLILHHFRKCACPMVGLWPGFQLFHIPSGPSGDTIPQRLIGVFSSGA